MSSSIEWTDITWNPTPGCDRVSPGCDHCYAMTLAKRLKAMGQPKYQADGDPRTSGPGFGVTVHEPVIWAPLRWPGRKTAFVDSMGDIGHPRIPRSAVVRTWAAMALTPQHTYQVLSKRPNRLAALLASDGFIREVGAAAAARAQLAGVALEERDGWTRGSTGTWMPPWPLPNVWVGTSIEDDGYAWRAGFLRKTGASVRFLSLEPLLGPLPSLDLDGIDWVIAGGESGPGFRPVDLAWVRAIRDRCIEQGIDFFFKQVGGRTPKAGGRELDGRTCDQMPARDGQRCPGCGKANQAAPCAFCGQLQDPACGHGTSYVPPSPDGPGSWRCGECGAVTAGDHAVPHLLPAGPAHDAAQPGQRERRRGTRRGPAGARRIRLGAR
jgi:protein gp37